MTSTGCRVYEKVWGLSSPDAKNFFYNDENFPAGGRDAEVLSLFERVISVFGPEFALLVP